MTETENGYLVHSEMPGVNKQDIDVAIEGNQVTISAEVKREGEKRDGERLLRKERHFGNIYRSFTLPTELDESACKAKLDNGVLELALVNKPQRLARGLRSNSQQEDYGVAPLGSTGLTTPRHDACPYDGVGGSGRRQELSAAH